MNAKIDKRFFWGTILFVCLLSILWGLYAGYTNAKAEYFKADALLLCEVVNNYTVDYNVCVGWVESCYGEPFPRVQTKFDCSIYE